MTKGYSNYFEVFLLLHLQVTTGCYERGMLMLNAWQAVDSVVGQMFELAGIHSKYLNRP